MSANVQKASNRERAKEMVVGFFVSAVFIALAVFTIVISGATLFKKTDFAIEVVLPDAMGLRRNDMVIAKGTTVGAVTDVYYDHDGVHVKAVLHAPVKFYEGYQITVVSTSILGGRQLVITEGDDQKTEITDVDKLTGTKPTDLMEDAGAAIKKIRDFLETDALDNLRNFSADISDISDRLNRGEGTLGKLLSSDSKVYDDLEDTIANIKSIAARLEAGEGTLGKLLSSDSAVYDDLQASIENIRKISDRLEAGEGTLGKLLSEDDKVYADLEATISDVRELLDDVREANTLSTFTGLFFSGF